MGQRDSIVITVPGQGSLELSHAALGIAVIGSEGAAGELLATTDVVVRDVREAIELLLCPLRLSATLRP